MDSLYKTYEIYTKKISHKSQAVQTYMKKRRANINRMKNYYCIVKNDHVKDQSKLSTNIFKFKILIETTEKCEQIFKL